MSVIVPGSSWYSTYPAISPPASTSYRCASGRSTTSVFTPPPYAPPTTGGGVVAAGTTPVSATPPPGRTSPGCTIEGVVDAGEAGLTRRVARLFTPYRGRLALIGTAILVTSVLGIANPFLTRAVFDQALFVPDGPDLQLLFVLVGLMILIPMVSALIGVGQTFLTTSLGNRVMQDLRNRLFEHLESMHLGFFTGTRTGDIQSRLGNDVGGVESVVTQTASSILSNAVTVIASLVAMLLLSWQLTLVAVALLPVFVLLQVQVGRVRRRIAARTQTSLSEMSSITQESLSVSGVLLAKIFNRQPFEIARYRAENETQAALQVRQAMTGQMFFATVGTFFGITPALVYLVAGLTANGPNGLLSAGTLVAFTTLQARLLFPIVNLLRGGARPRLVPLPERPAGAGAGRRRPELGAAGPVAAGPARPAGRGGRPQRRRQDHAVLPGAPAVRPGPGAGHAGRDRRARPDPRLARLGDRDGDAGDVPVPRVDPGQPAVCGRRRHRRAAGGGGAGGQHPRPDHELPGRVRHDRRGAGVPAVRRGTAAAGDRPGDPQGPGRADPGRGDLGAGHHQRAAGAGGAGAGAGRSDHDRDRAPAVHDPRRGRDLRTGRRAAGRAGHARAAARA